MANRADDVLLNNGILPTVKVMITVGVGAIGLYAASTLVLQSAIATASIGLIVAIAALLGGGLLGFLFGIPRTLQAEAAPLPASGNGHNGNGTSYRPNTNLEQISDWLTKMLVGIGLIEIHPIADNVSDLARKVADSIGGDGAHVFAFGLLVYFSICGFLLGYLWTRLFLPVAFRHSDDAAISVLTTEVNDLKLQFTHVGSHVDAIKQQTEIDAEAINIVERQLRAGPDAPVPAQAELDDVIGRASPSTKMHVFYQAQRLRTSTWRDEKSTMERTIPLFRALIACDTKDRFHRNHGQLGFALKDKLDPSPEDLREAEHALTKAIEIRGDWHHKGFVLYEFNRAVCRMMLDSAFREERRSPAAVRKAIEDDLEAAQTSKWLAGSVIPGDEPIQKWLTLNRPARALPMRRSA
jgi:hypothetical protein